MGKRMMKSIRLENRMSQAGRPCIWVQTGIVRRKNCEIDYACKECRFERALRRVARKNASRIKSGQAVQGKSGRIVAWEEKMKALPPSKRPCIHHLKQRIDFRACTNDYRCGSCEFDQYFYDEYRVHAVVKPIDILEVEGFKVPQGYYLHRGHTWARIEEGGLARVGFDEFALRVLGPPDRVEAPLMGKVVKQGRGDIGVFRGNNKAMALSPVSGVVTAINPELREKGSLAHREPYSEGWVMTVHADGLREDLKNLMILDESKAFLGDEVGRLYRMMEEVAGPLAADGGQLGQDIYGSLPQLGWDRLVQGFLRA
jgi:glycine cleavage system H lipoate-binding protein